MCLMYGMSLKDKAKLVININNYADGIGYSYFKKDNIVLNKFFPNSEEKFNKVSLNQNNFLFHIRQATTAICYENTHPFIIDNNFSLMHNGYFTNKEKLISYFKKYITNYKLDYNENADSKFLAYFVYEIIKKLNLFNELTINKITNLLDLLKEINNYAVMNLFFSYKDFVFIYKDINNYNKINFIYIKNFDKIELKNYFCNCKLLPKKDYCSLPEGYIFFTNNFNNNKLNLNFNSEYNTILNENYMRLIILNNGNIYFGLK